MNTKKSIVCTRLFWLLLFVTSLQFFASATHIVGGVLNYTYLGGSSYVIRLKLYRDCGSGTAAFPANVIISVRGNNGATFSPSKDITMTLGSVTSVPGNTLPCAVNPNPMPCVQEGNYTVTVNNLPATSSGYHLYYQVSARNLSLNNVNNACNCVGETFYAFIPGSSSNAACSCTATSNSNPYFTNLPPLFLCVNQAFTFNHAAVDPNGDSLAYSMYTPYNGDNGNGPLDPTFTNNIASFTPVTFLPGYTANNPLGTASFFTIDPITGVITATPNQVGQFVVGVKVKEYRNGVLLSETLRDVQFNVLNCPSPPPGLAITNFSMSANCTRTINAGGITAASASWQSIAPGSLGQYNTYLSCTSACANVSITAPASAPPFVDYKICGTSTNCAGTAVCDTFRVFFVSALSASILPNQPIICQGQTSTTLTAQASGGAPPYSFLWNNVNPSQSINVGAGTYNLKVTDATGCAPDYQTVIVSTFTAPISVSAGSDQTLCITNPIATLNGTVGGAGGGLWSGGTGTFNPSNTQLSNLFYQPSAAELSAGSVKLFLTSTGNGACQSKSDSLVIYFANFTGTVSLSTNSVTCYNGSNGSASITMLGGYSPHTYTWSNNTSGSNVNALSQGVYSVLIANAIGCVSQQSFQISQATALAISSTVSPLLCAGLSNASIQITPTGGTAPYSTSWWNTLTSIPSGNNLSAGTYTALVSDSHSCSATYTFAIASVAAVSISFSTTPVSCYGLSDATVNAQVSGGLAPYTYSWFPSYGTSPALTGIPAGNYTLLVTDQNNCTSSATVIATQPTSLSLSITTKNETCAQLYNGSATVTASGGTGGYQYQWLPGAVSSSIITNCNAGNFTVQVSDNNACKTSSIINITQPPLLIASVQTIKHISCFGASDGSVSPLITGGTLPYTYTWLPSGSNQAQISLLGPGTITLQVSDSNTCTAGFTVTITQPAALNAAYTITNVSCFGGNNASIQASTNGGTAPYSYSWPTGTSTTTIASGLSAATISLSVTDANNCSQVNTLTITQPPALNSTIVTNPITCYSQSNASLIAQCSGGTAPYSNFWQPGSVTGSTLNNIGGGTYTLTTTDSKGCINATTVQVTAPSQLFSIVNTSNTSCSYLVDGKAQAIVNGGTGLYVYVWDGSVASSTVTNLSAGTHSLAVFDANNCVSSQTFVILASPALALSFTNTTQVTCAGNSDAQASALVTGGTAPYQYSWNSGFSTAATATALAAGNYTVHVTDVNSCTVAAVIAILEPLPLNLNTSITNVVCNAASNGAIAVLSSGGTAPYVNTIYPGAIAGTNFTGLNPGTYTVQTTDANQCSASITVAIVQPISLTAVTSVTAPTCTNSNGIASVSVTAGGLAPFTYTWLPSGGNGTLATNLAAGSYTILITDNSGCTSSRLVNISDLNAAAVSILSATHVSCYSGNDAALSAGISGGVGPSFSYQWQPTGGTSATASNLTAGTYYLKVTDSNSCIGISNTSVITQPSSITVAYTSKSVSCKNGSNGSATITAFGGIAPFTYTWLPISTNTTVATNLIAGTYTTQVKDANGCASQFNLTIPEPATSVSISLTAIAAKCFSTATGSINMAGLGGTAPYTYSMQTLGVTAQSVNALSAGIYTCSSIDFNLCQASATIQITEPLPLTRTLQATSANCNLANGSATAVISGGTGPYTFTWFPSAQITATLNAVPFGNYSVTISDANNCSLSGSLSISNNPAPTISIAVSSSVTCYNGANGSLSANLTAGTAPYSYTWFPSLQNTSTATNLTAGSHTLLVQAANGCTAVAVSPIISQASPLLSSVLNSSVTCYGASTAAASLFVTGGTAPYTYNWSPTSYTTSNHAALAAGSYTVLITDANLCSTSQSFTIIQPQAPLSVTFSQVTNVNCFGNSSGTIVAQSSGGTGPYTYTWSPTAFAGATLSAIPAGAYSVQVADARNCSTSISTLITQPLNPLSFSVSATAARCFGQANGSATTTAWGGTAPYTYFYNSSATSASLVSTLSAGIQTVVVVDANNCSSLSNFNISQPAILTATLQSVPAACAKQNGLLSALVNGGTAPYSFNWLNVAVTTATLSNLPAGVYTVDITDANACALQKTATLSTIVTPSISVLSQNNCSCFGSTNGSLALQTTGGSAPFQYIWLPSGANSSSAQQLSAGTYTIYSIDARGCRDSITKQITEPSALVLSLATKTNVSCYNTATGAASVVAVGGTPNYSFGWNNGTTTALNTNLSAGNYSIQVLDAKNCSATLAVQISQPPLLTVSVQNIQQPLCKKSTGSATIKVSGGLPPYTYTWSPASNQNSAVLQSVTSGTYTALVRDNAMCSVTKTIVLLQPSKVITSALKCDTICFGSAATLTATAIGGTAPYHFAWAPQGEITSGSYTPSPQISSNYTVVAFDANGCAGTEVVSSVNVYNLTKNNLMLQATSPICPKAMSLLTTTLNGNTGPLHYSWSNNLGATAGPFMVSPAQTTTYYLTLTNDCGITIRDSALVHVNALPSPAFVSDTTQACIEGYVHFTDLSTSIEPNDPILFWTYNFGDGEFSGQQNPEHLFSTPGIYTPTLTVTTDRGCSASREATFTILALQPPAASFSFSAQHYNLPMEPLQCVNTSTGAVKYRWLFDDGSESNLKNANYRPRTVGTSSVTLIAISERGCTDTASKVVNTSAALIFPTAFTPNLESSSAGAYDQSSLDNDVFFPYTTGVTSYHIQLFDRWGELIFESNSIAIGWDGYYKGKICQEGVYFYTAEATLNDGSTFNQKGDVTLLK